MKQNLPAEAQKVWMNAFNAAHGQGKSESESAQIAWGAVKNSWKKNEQGNWVKKTSFIEKNDERRYTLGVVYEPDVVDLQGDFATADEIEKACWEFSRLLQAQMPLVKMGLQLLDAVVKAAKNNETLKLDVTDLLERVEKSGGVGLGYAHAVWSDGIGEIVENYIAPVDMIIGNQTVKKGTWLMGVIWTPEYYEKVKKGEITGFSMGGTAIRIPVEGGVQGAQ